ncbi:hypothetical protein LTR78_009329 [Recurvomyces mirabilis]|uniref:DUF7924 domain-containing protein n=1 Tax=Recurvomyces mirabilis TaxID=574656 RepID=A0AAE0TNS5_9PEZI|nr:hypothetical protein LTR78_009329 [Recurvomyces mirabilis]KAK5150332.1 hypothetical protein LTS14_010171 [Recurvomyces mirabilis]
MAPSECKPLRIPTKAKRHSTRLAQACKNRLPSPPSEGQPATQKRKRQERHDEDLESGLKRTHKLQRVHDTPTLSGSSTANTLSYGSPVHWEDYFEQWPPNRDMDESMTKKRNRTPSHTPSSSYSKSVRDGEAPAAWTRQHEEKMQEAGLFMTDYQNRASITDDCKKLCDELHEKNYDDPTGSLFKPQRLAKILERVRFRNEARVVRDIMPVLVPSPELLHIDGVASLKDICEALNAEWTQCNTLCGPRPKPDFVAGVAGSAFTNEEREKLQLSHTSSSPNSFPENMYYPFLICEAKGSDKPVDAAERQAMHSASIAVLAQIQLYRKFSAAEELDGKVLVFSIAHDASMIKVFGHFAKIEGDKLTFFRHQLYLSDIATDLRSEASSRAYNITRAIYDVFFPQHLARIRSALSKLRGSTVASFTSQLDLVDGSQESTVSKSLQEDARFKKPSLSSTAMLQQENERLRDQLLEMVRNQQTEAISQRQEQDKQRVVMEQQLAQQKEQTEQQLVQQMEQMERQLAQQKDQMERQLAQQKDQMERQLAQQKEQMAQQLAQQKEHMGQQLAHQCELIALLKESKSK